MFKQIYKMDKDLFLIETLVVEFDKDGLPVNELGDNMVIADNPHGLHKPKWTGAKWTEGATPEEIAELTKVEPVPPTESEQRLSDLELMMTELLMGGLI